MNYLEYANSPAMWVFATIIFAVVVLQAIIFFRYSCRVAAEADLSRSDQVKAMRIGAVSAIGPSLAVVIVAVGLLPVFGAPIALMRVGMVGSVSYELTTANLASEALGVPLGGEGFDGAAFAAVFFSMALGAGVWMAVVLFGIRGMGALNRRVNSWNPWLMNAVPAAALLAVVVYICTRQAISGTTEFVVLASSSVVMAVGLWLARRQGLAWLREWSLGISMVTGLVIAGFIGAAA